MEIVEIVRKLMTLRSGLYLGDMLTSSGVLKMTELIAEIRTKCNITDEDLGFFDDEFADACEFNVEIICRKADCKTCGWNPKNEELRENRSKSQLRRIEAQKGAGK